MPNLDKRYSHLIYLVAQHPREMNVHVHLAFN